MNGNSKKKRKKNKKKENDIQNDEYSQMKLRLDETYINIIWKAIQLLQKVFNMFLLLLTELVYNV